MIALVNVLAEAGAYEAKSPFFPEPNEAIWAAVCFGLLLAVVGPMVFPKINKMFSARATHIETNMFAATREREEAESLRVERQKRLDDAHLESQKILDTARSNADRLEDELRAQAEDQARRIVDRAQASLSVERSRVEVELQQQVGEMVVSLTQRIVGETMTREQHLKLVDRYIDDLRAAAK